MQNYKLEDWIDNGEKLIDFQLENLLTEKIMKEEIQECYKNNQKDQIQTILFISVDLLNKNNSTETISKPKLKIIQKMR